MIRTSPVIFPPLEMMVEDGRRCPKCSYSCFPQPWGSFGVTLHLQEMKLLLLYPKPAWSPLQHLPGAEDPDSHQHPLLARQSSIINLFLSVIKEIPLQNTEFPMESQIQGSSSTLPQHLGDEQSYKHTQNLLFLTS